MAAWLDKLLLAGVDSAYSLIPTPRPAGAGHTRVVAHRGERDGRRVLENTYAAFDPLIGSGVWAIEFDIRWTADLVPVVAHDADLKRVFGHRQRISALDWPALHALEPRIPRLDAFVARYTPDFHLMAELKPEPIRDAALQNQRLDAVLGPALRAGRAHVLTLAPEQLADYPDIRPAHTLTVARWNTAAISDEALASHRAGIGMQFALLTKARLARHHAAGQIVGTGFPSTRRVVWQQINHGVDLLFTNKPLRVQRWLDELGAHRHHAR